MKSMMKMSGNSHEKGSVTERERQCDRKRTEKRERSKAKQACKKGGAWLNVKTKNVSFFIFFFFLLINY